LHAVPGGGMKAPVSMPGLYLITPILAEPAASAPSLAAACQGGEVAAVLLRLAPGDERTLVNRIKTLAPVAQDHGAAVVVAVEGQADLPTVAARGGADGVHAGRPADLTALRERLKGDRILGAGGLRSRHDAMEAGEAGVDYLLFGEPSPDGMLPPLDAVVERAGWWAEIFQTPCVAHAPALEAIPRLAATGAEFVALGDAVWSHPDGPRAATAAASALLAASTLHPATAGAP
jgi:thiamine-phosphate pyrophosphorylase